MGFLRTVSFPTTAAFLHASGSSKATLLSGSRCRVHTLNIIANGSKSAANARLRPCTSNTDTDQFPKPVCGTLGQGIGLPISLGGKLYPDGLRVVSDAGFTGCAVIEEEPRVGQAQFPTGVTLDQVRQLLGKSTPHPLDGLTKWGTFPVETATAATWASATDSELFTITLPRGYTREGGRWRLIVLHHQLSGDYNSPITNSPISKLAADRGYIVLSPTSILPDTWPNDTATDALEAAITWTIDALGVNPDDIHLVGFSLGGQAVLRFAATHRDGAGIVPRTVAVVEPGLDMVAWYRKQWNNTKTGQSVPPVPGPATLLCDPAPVADFSTVWRSHVERHDCMNGAWPGSEGASAVGLAYRASGVLAMAVGGYAETGPMVSLAPLNPEPALADLYTAAVDADRSSIASALWAPLLMFYGTDTALLLLPPLFAALQAHIAAINPNGEIGMPATFVNVGAIGNGGSHTWGIFDPARWFDWMDHAPLPVRYPASFEMVSHIEGFVLGFGRMLKTSANDMARARVVTVTTPGSEGFVISSEFNCASVEIDMAKSPLAAFNFGAGNPLKITTGSAHLVVVKNMPHAPAGATGGNVGVVSIPSLAYPGDANSITIAPSGVGAITASIT